MFQLTPPSPPSHATARFWLDIADKLIKLAAVFIGGLWTWWNFRKSRTYEQKLEFEVVGTVFVQGDLYGDIRIVVKNIGATMHSVQDAGTYCELSVVRSDLTEQTFDIFDVFASKEMIEPGEFLNDTRCWRIHRPIHDILWIKLSLRVVSNGVEWISSRLIRVEAE